MTLLVLFGCQTTMSLDEAKKITANFSRTTFVPPPRRIDDITAVLGQESPDVATMAAHRAEAELPLPSTSDPSALADFYYKRGRAAGRVGRTKQALEDLNQAANYSVAVRRPDQIIWTLAVAEFIGGRLSRSIEQLKRAMTAVPRTDRGSLTKMAALLARVYAWSGDLERAEAAATESDRYYREMLATCRQACRAEWIAHDEGNTAGAWAALAASRGQYREAERLYARAIAALEGNSITATYQTVELEILSLSRVLSAQGRSIEAEVEARKALKRTLRRSGKYSWDTAQVLTTLSQVVLEQARPEEAEQLARVALEIFESVGASSEALAFNQAREQLIRVLVVQRRWNAAVAEYDRIRTDMSSDAETFQKFFGANIDWAIAVLKTGQIDPALSIARATLKRSLDERGGKDRRTAEARALLGATLAARGDHTEALRQFRESMAVLLKPMETEDDETDSRSMSGVRLGLLLDAYISFLSEMRGTPLTEKDGFDVVAEAFSVADVARGYRMQRAVAAGAARAAATTPALADVVRREQDARKQIAALQALVARALGEPETVHTVTELRRKIEALNRARERLTEQVVREFPEYAELVNPPPLSLAQARAALRPKEAMVVTYVGNERTIIWAFGMSGPVAFAVVPISDGTLRGAVAALRRALEPTGRTLDDIVAYDVELAHQLYRELLVPVIEGWRGAETLLVVAHGVLGDLPFGALVTEPLALGPEIGLPFSRYRSVPWLARQYSVSMLPSAMALTTIRRRPMGAPVRRGFVGFGDPYFSSEQAQQAVQGRVVASRESNTIAVRDVGKVGIHAMGSATLARLPRLPDTADEILSIADATGADIGRDVFLGERANEHNVYSTDLTRYRVIAFATHGLLPGDLDGLTQPALALAAPDVARVDGDGLLTVEKILPLRLDADWVVLSACNTGGGSGAGAEAFSGLGRAFFYAGARAMLVSSWPVETTSARALTTEVFRRQKADAQLGRAKALRETLMWLVDEATLKEERSGRTTAAYAHPFFWAPFVLVGDGG